MTSARHGWYAKRLDADKASIRLRMIAPMAGLRTRGIDVEPYRAAHGGDYAALIFSKSFTPAALAAARAAESRGTAVIVDVCDNMFDQVERAGKAAKQARIVEQLSRATLVTVATPCLGEQLARHLPDIAPRLRVVPDMLEDLDASPPPGLLDRWRLARLRGFLARHAGALHCVWFGKSSGAASGFVHLADALPMLERFAARHPVTLTVIGDDRAHYARAAAHWTIPHHYLPWSRAGFANALRLHRVAVIPVGRNAYTIGKTINRPATAILAGLGVVADAIPSYEPLRPHVALDDWPGGLARYAFGWDAERQHLAAARAELLRHYGPDAVLDRWAAVLAEATGPN